MKDRRSSEHPSLVVRRWQVALAFVAITLSFVFGLLWVNHVSREASHQNHARITDILKTQEAIQASRVESCKQTYRSFHDVFTPFFPPPKKQSPEVRRSLAKLNRLISQLVARCDTQTSNGGTP